MQEGSGDGAWVSGTGAARWPGIAVVLAAAALATAPLVLRGTSCGNDFDFHLVSWIDALHSWRHWIAYPHWAASANYTAGEPRFVFYPPLEWMLGAALGAMLPWSAVPTALVFLLLAGTGLATRALAREAMEDGPATLAGCIAIFSGYALYTAYARSAYAELAGGISIPLMLLFLLRDGRAGSTNGSGTAGDFPQGLKPRSSSGLSGTSEVVPLQNKPTQSNSSASSDVEPNQNAFYSSREQSAAETGPSFIRLFSSLKAAAPSGLHRIEGVPALAMVIAAAWLSNVPVGLMVSYLLAAVALARAAGQRSWRPLARAAAGMTLGLALAGIYLAPAVAEQHWVDVSQALLDPDEQIQNSFLFRHQVSPNPDTELHNTELNRISWIAVGMIAVAMAGTAVSWRRRRLPGGRRWWIPLALIPAGALVLMLPVSLPLWNLLPRMRWLQFSWRWLVAVEAPMAIFAVAAVWTEKRRWMVAAACGAACLGMTLLAGRIFFTPCYPEDSIPGMLAAYRSGTGFDGADEYSPEYADSSLIAMGLPGGCLVADAQTDLGVGVGDQQPHWTPAQGSCLQTFPFDGGDAERWALRGTASRSGWLVLRLRAYPAWRVRVNGQAESNLPRRLDGLIAVPVPAGPIQVTVDWTATPDQRAGRSISLAALILITAVCVLEQRRRSRARVS